MKDSAIRRWTGWQPRDGNSEDDFRRWVNGWSRTWGSFLLIGALLPFGERRTLIWLWQLGDAGGGGMLLAILPVVALGAVAVFAVPRMRSVGLLAPLALGLAVHAGFAAIRAQERQELFWDIPTEIIQVALAVGLGAALIAVGNHLRKATAAGRRSRMLSGLGGLVVVAAFLIPVQEDAPLLTIATESASQGLYYPSPFFGLCLYGVLGILGGVPRRIGWASGMSVLVRILLGAIPLVPVLGSMLFEGIGRFMAPSILVWMKTCLTVFGTFGLLGVGLVVWFRPPGGGDYQTDRTPS